MPAHTASTCANEGLHTQHQLWIFVQFKKTIKMMNIKIKAQEMDSEDLKSLEDMSNQDMGNQIETSGDNLIYYGSTVLC